MSALASWCHARASWPRLVRASHATRHYFSTCAVLHNDRETIAAHHADLLNARFWHLATPSQSLSVLGVLFGSGVLIGGVEHMVTHSVSSMHACMTTSERSFVQSIAATMSSVWARPTAGDVDRNMLQASMSTAPMTTTTTTKTTPPDSAAVSRADMNAQEQLVVRWYTAASQRASLTALVDVSETMSEAFVRALRFPYALMLFELVVTQHVRVAVSGRATAAAAAAVHTALLTHVTAQVNACQGAVCVPVLWLLTVLCAECHRDVAVTAKGDVDEAAVAAAAAARQRQACGGLYTSCVRHVHRVLPLLTLEQCVRVYVLLVECTTYEQPFVVLAELSRLLLRRSAVDMLACSTPVLLQLLHCRHFLRAHTAWTAQLCVALLRHDRVCVMNVHEAVSLLSVVAHMHLYASASLSAVTASRTTLAHAHERLFAAVFVHTDQMTMHHTLTALESAEAVHQSTLALSVPVMFAERLRRRMRATLDDAVVAPREQHHHDAADVDCTSSDTVVLHVVLRFYALLRRGTLLPCLDDDEAFVQQLLHRLRQRSTLRPPPPPQTHT